VSAGTFTTPRPAPSILIPIVAGSLVIALALPVYLVADWRLEGWALAATLWAGSQAFAYLLVRLRAKGELVASGAAAFGMMFRAIAVMVVLVVVAVGNAELALGAALLYALAYTLELGVSMASYFGGPDR
jgi:hypothetical protein